MYKKHYYRILFYMALISITVTKVLNENSQLTDQPVPVSFESFCIQPSNANCFQTVRMDPLVNNKNKESQYIHEPHHHNCFTAFFRDHLGEPVPEENFCILWCKRRLTEADTLTIRLGATPSGLTSNQCLPPPSPINLQSSGQTQ